MRINFLPYQQAASEWPASGRHILASFDDDEIVVYQAFNDEIAAYAIANQTFVGCRGYNVDRMTWIKTNFLWMMYRCGWAAKDANQSRVLAIHMSRTGFDEILRRSVDVGAQSTCDRDIFLSMMARSDVRCQWDPDHDPAGGKQERRAIQLGLKGNSAKEFIHKWVNKIEDITDAIVVPQRGMAMNLPHSWSQLLVPGERVYTPLAS